MMNYLKMEVIETYNKYGNVKVLVKGGKSYTGFEISNEIKNDTDFGKELAGGLIRLTIDLLSRNKIERKYTEDDMRNAFLESKSSECDNFKDWIIEYGKR